MALEITSPAGLAEGATISSSEDLALVWSPPQPEAVLHIAVVAIIGGQPALLRCDVEDDGATVIPAAALAPLGGNTGGMTFQRDLVRRVADGATAPRRVIDVITRFEVTARLTYE